MDLRYILLLVLFAFFFHSTNTSASLSPRAAASPPPIDKETLVNPTLVTSDKGAVCLSGNPAAYYFLPGYGHGINNWLVYLNGGGWCKNVTDCQQYIKSRGGNVDPFPIPFQYILSNNRDENPEFFNWNKVSIRYCDGSSFTGHSEIVIKNGTKYYFRGARIFNAVIMELLAKGMERAQNALLVGSSAGGVAATIYCDRFREFFHPTSRVKCFSDGGYFFLSKHHIQGNTFLSIFEGLIKLHGSEAALPKSCTSKLNSALCFFPANLQADIRTPIFFLNSAFDRVQINYTLSKEDAICAEDGNCSVNQIKALQGLRLDLLDVLPKHKNNSLKGVLITSPFAHTRLSDPSWNSLATGAKETYDELFRDWYFDRKFVHIIDNYPCPYNCTSN